MKSPDREACRCSVQLLVPLFLPLSSCTFLSLWNIY